MIYERLTELFTISSINQIQRTDNNLFRKCMLKAEEIIIGDYWRFVKADEEESSQLIENEH